MVISIDNNQDTVLEFKPMLKFYNTIIQVTA